LEVVDSYDNLDAVAEFARNVAVVTFEFENVPADTAAVAARHAPVRPAGTVLHTTQNRLREKTFLASSGFPTTPFRAVRSVADVRTAVAELGLPAVLKTASFGYDGKGQSKVTSRRAAIDSRRERGTPRARIRPLSSGFTKPSSTSTAKYRSSRHAASTDHSPTGA
jgi:5-(carboxyamino)imidazole ribonucleotide synthase